MSKASPEVYEFTDGEATWFQVAVPVLGLQVVAYPRDPELNAGFRWARTYSKYDIDSAEPLKFDTLEDAITYASPPKTVSFKRVY